MTREEAAYQLENYLKNTSSDKLSDDVIVPLVNTIYPIDTYYKAGTLPTLYQWYLRREKHITISNKHVWKEHSPDFNVIYTQDTNHMFVKYKHLQPSWWQLPKPVDLIQNILKNYNVDGFDLHEVDGYVQLTFSGGALTIRPEGSTYVVNGANGVNADLVEAVRYQLNNVSIHSENVDIAPAIPKPKIILTKKQAFDNLIELNEWCVKTNTPYTKREKEFRELVNIVYPRADEPIVTFSQPTGVYTYYSINRELFCYDHCIKVAGGRGYLFHKKHDSSLHNWALRLEIPEIVKEFLVQFPDYVVETMNSSNRYVIHRGNEFKGWFELTACGKFVIDFSTIQDSLVLSSWINGRMQKSTTPPKEAPPSQVTTPTERQLERTLPLGSNIVSRGLNAVVKDKKGMIVNLPLDPVRQEKFKLKYLFSSTTAEEEPNFVPISINIPKLPSFNDEE